MFLNKVVQVLSKLCTITFFNSLSCKFQKEKVKEYVEKTCIKMATSPCYASNTFPSKQNFLRVRKLRG